MIRGITFDKQIFKSNDFAMMTKRFFNNSDGIVNGCNLSASGNTVLISKGWFVSSGYYTNLSSQEVVEITQSGTLVYEIDLTKINTVQAFNQGSFKVITGTPTQQDLFDGGTLYQMPIAEVTTDGTNATITETIWENIQEDLQTQINNISTYSTSETKVGTWIDGKPIYRKTITISSFPSYSASGSIGGTGDYNTGITNMETAINMYGMYYDTSSENQATFSICNNYNFNADRSINTRLKKDGTKLTITYGLYDFSSYSGYVTLEYTKLTD